MAKSVHVWKKGRGKLGIFQPLLGSWTSKNESPQGNYTCVRKFELILDGKYIQMDVSWNFKTYSYTEHAIIGVKDDVISFWSFTSDGKRSEGTLSDGTDVHPDAICFEAEMPAGIARMIYWPNEDGGFNWAVESKNKKGWTRFTEHSYTSV